MYDVLCSHYNRIFSFIDIRDHNLHATGRSRKEWIHMKVAEQVWGFRPASSSSVLDTDDDIFTNIPPPLVRIVILQNHNKSNIISVQSPLITFELCILILTVLISALFLINSNTIFLYI